ncbi:hypothetical protein K2173_010839 [Erythroxylum novogranatense]|uniref:Non-structural maintenance of chromosomes element 4 n=1 Tax=Erythroxylum novogranatense TaxID=1862640 RepID=A0AAV8T193_9ROSI|nr:hypothetical protein K2173_010839 [Erythroxylum novogranatense]
MGKVPRKRPINNGVTAGEMEGETLVGRFTRGQDQTERDRRLIRSEYLVLHNKINEKREDLMNVDSERFKSIIKEVEDLHEKVQKPREQVADAETLLDLASALASSVRSQPGEGVSVADFVGSLLTGFGESPLGQEGEEGPQVSIKWADIGLAVSSIFMSCNGFNTMVGPMSTELKHRKAVVRSKREKPTNIAHPEKVDDTGPPVDKDTTKNMLKMFQILSQKRCVKLEHLILNRKSFAQTVENLFALSFLARDGRAQIKVDENGSHLVSPKNAPEKGEARYTHFIFRFDYKDWELMKGLVCDGEELMAHRQSSDAGSQEEPAANGNQGNRAHTLRQSSDAGSLEEPAANGNQENRATTPIRKLSRNRGLVVNEESVVQDSPEVDDSSDDGPRLRKCKRKIT